MSLAVNSLPPQTKIPYPEGSRVGDEKIRNWIAVTPAAYQNRNESGMEYKSLNKGQLNRDSLLELLPEDGTCSIGLTSVWLSPASNFASYYTVAGIAAWVRKVRPRARVLYSTHLEELLQCEHVWCTSTSGAWNKVNKLGRAVVQAGKTFIAGGHHATALPETLKFGLAFCGPIEIYNHIDELPLPDWSVFEGNPPKAIMTSRGCPYNCQFCSSRNFWKNTQFKSPEKIIEEAQMVKDLGAEFVPVFDDLFVADKKRLRQAVELVNVAGLDTLQYWCQVRCNLVDLETIRLLKAMNVRRVQFGAESGSDRVLSLMNKRATVEENQRAVDLLYDQGIPPEMTLILGYPGESEKDLELTVDFIARNRSKCSSISVWPCIPFPGTPLWDHFVREHAIDVHAFDWETLSLDLDSIDWDKYVMLTDRYPKDRLITVVEWNRTENDRQTEKKSLVRNLVSKIRGALG
jgi:Radical SAM superfamily